jgi:hypothetical protein
MIRVFSKDECVPDALTANQWLDREGIDWSHEVRVDGMYDGAVYEFFASKAVPGVPVWFYLKESSCGVFEEVFEFESKEEWIAAINEKVDAFLAGVAT